MAGNFSKLRLYIVVELIWLSWFDDFMTLGYCLQIHKNAAQTERMWKIVTVDELLNLRIYSM